MATVASLLALVALDVALIATGLLPPTASPGDAEAGWRPAPATGRFEDSPCFDPSSRRERRIRRNEDGVRTNVPVARLIVADSVLRVAASGDSHTELCAANDSVHFGVLERAMTAAGRPTHAVGYGAGKYSPLQAYRATAGFLRRYHARVFVLNVYLGNDFYDLLRVDDRPHFVRADTGYAIAPPVWYQEDPPGEVPRSRVLHAARLLAKATGIRRVWLRVRYLADVAREQGQGPGVVLAYLDDLRRGSDDALGYPQALVAQMLNQQLFFHRFPGSRDESVRRMRALLAYVRQQEPGRVLVLSPIPSVRLMPEARSDSVLRRTMARLPVTLDEGIAEERALYDALRQAAAATDWIFVDNLPALQAHAMPPLLYNRYDYHLEPLASEIIGQAQARAILDALGPSRLPPAVP